MLDVSGRDRWFIILENLACPEHRVIHTEGHQSMIIITFYNKKIYTKPLRHMDGFHLPLQMFYSHTLF